MSNVGIGTTPTIVGYLEVSPGIKSMGRLISVLMAMTGISIDLNNHVACWGCEPDTQPEPIVDAFESRG